MVRPKVSSEQIMAQIMVQMPGTNLVVQRRAAVPSLHQKAINDVLYGFVRVRGL